MGIEIVTGKRGSGHVTPDEDGNRNATFVGKESCVVDLYTGFELDIISANQAHIGRGVGYLQGRQFEINAEGEDVVINSGTQGQNRNTVVYAHYTREPTTSVEAVDLVVLDGTPTTGTPVDPEVNIGDLFTGGLEAYFPLYRIVLEGVNIVSTDQLFDVKPLLMDAWDSVSYVRSEIDGWEVTKYSDGRATCKKVQAYTATSWSAEGALYCAHPKVPAISYPTGLFIEAPTQSRFVEGGSFCFPVEGGSYATKDTAPDFWLYRVTMTGVSEHRIQRVAEGRWK